VALSQSGPAALAVAARLFAGGEGPRPRSLALLGCQLDPTRGSSPLQRALAGWPPEALAAQFTTVVRRGYPGAGRRVYPAVLQLLAYSLVSPALYAEVQGGLWRELLAGEEGGIYARQHADLHSLADVPAELFLDALAWMQGQGPWAGPRPVVAGVAIDPAPFRGLPVLTLESAEDELVGAGQTHGIAERLGLRASRAATLAGARHHDLFTGPGFLARTGPLLRRFHAAAGG
jgi:poly(3-hydroxybutyrate) depolymerase